jgi:NADH:ubiquinone oxidoreductase subunit E
MTGQGNTQQEVDGMNQEAKQSKSGAVMVIGGGIAGIQSSLDLADSGFKVYLLEQTPAIGGTMAQLDKTFPTNDCAMCVISPKLVACGRHLNIDLITNSEILGVTGEAGRFTVRVKQKPRYIDPAKCTGCGACTQNCPVTKIAYEVERSELEVGKEDRDIADGILARYAGQKGILMPVLQEINRHYNYLPKDVLCYVAAELGLNISEIHSIAEFYNAFSLEPRGRHKVSVCMGTTCYVRGADRLLQRLCEELDTAPGSTTKDMRFTVESARCLGCCSLAPAIMVNDKVYGRVKVSDLSKILKDYK